MFSTRTPRLQKSSRQVETSVPAWVWLVGLFAVLIIWQGAFRKWWLPELQTQLYIAKDVVLLGAIMLYGIRYGFHLPRPLQRTMLSVIWGGLAFIAILQVSNPEFPSLAGSVMGLKSYLLYTPLLILIPAVMNRVQNPKRLVTTIAVLGIAPVLLLGYYQYGQPLDAWVNQYVAEEAHVVGVGERPRVTGTFSYIGGMDAFLPFAIFFAIAIFLSGLQYRDQWYTWLGGILLLMALIVAPMNGSRSVVLGVLVSLPFILYTVFRGRRGVIVFALTAILAFGGGYAFTESEWAKQGWNTLGERIERGQATGEQESRIEGLLRDPLQKMITIGLIGYGTGGTNNASAALAGYKVDPGVYYEPEPGRVIIELGAIGGLFYFILKAWLAWTAWQALIRARTSWTTLLAITAFGYIFLRLVEGMIVFNHVSSSLYWICAGIAVWLWSRQEMELVARRSRQKVSTS